MKRTTVAAALAGTGVALVLAQPASAAETAPVYQVTQEGMTAEESARLAEAYRIPDALHENGAFGYVGDDVRPGPARARSPPARTSPAGRPSRRRSTPARSPSSGRSAPTRRSSGRPELTELIGLTDLELNPKVSHAKLTLSDTRRQARRASTRSTRRCRTTSQLAGLPVTGQGAKLRITFARDGSVTQLSSSLRKLEQAGEEPIIPSDEARKACARCTTTASARASRRSATCCPRSAPSRRSTRATPATRRPSRATQAHRQVPAVEGTGPKADDRGHAAAATTSSPRPRPPAAPARTRYKWSSSTHRARGATTATQIAYERRPRGKTTGETLTLEVTDVNGLTRHRLGSLRRRRHVPAEADPGRRRLRQAGHRPDRRRHRADRRRVAVRAGQRDRLQERDGRPRASPPRSTGAAGAPGSRTSRTGLDGRHRPHLRRQRRRPVVHGPRLVRRLHVQEHRRRHARSRRPTPAGATATWSGCSSSPARCCATPTAPTTTSPAGAERSTACTCSTASTPTRTASAAARAARFASLPVPAPDPVVDAAGPDGPQRVGADGDRQGAERRRLPLDGQHRPRRRHQHRRLLLGPGPDRAGHPRRRPHRPVVDHGDGLASRRCRP